MEAHAHNARPSRESVLLAQHGLRSAALFYWNLNEPMMRRTGRVTRAYLEEIPLPAVTDSPLYPIGGWAMALAQIGAKSVPALIAALASAARVPQADAAGTCVMNVMLHPNCFHGDGARAVQDLIRAYFAAGGHADPVLGRRARRPARGDAGPRPVPGLIVRVGGFNARFVDMSRPIQQQILDRTVHAAGA